MSQAKLVTGILGGTLVLLVVVGMLMTRLSGQPGDVDGGRVLGAARLTTGNDEAKVTIVEFSDFQCPACKQAQYLVKEILQQYPDQIRLVYRHFPLIQIHKNAFAAAELAEAAYGQEKFWEMHDLLFERQGEWAENKEKLEEYRRALGIDEAGDYKELVQRDIRDGQALGVNATPTFFVNGKKTDVVKLRVIVEEELGLPSDRR